MTKSQALRSACLSAAVVTAFGLPAEAAAPPDKKPLNLSAGSSLTYIHMRVVAGLTSKTFIVFGGDGTVDGLVGGPGGNTYSFDIPSSFVGEPTRYLLIGANPATAVSPASVVVSMGDGSVAIGRSFDSVFPGFDESSVAAAIADGSSALDAFVDAAWSIPGLHAPIDSVSTLVGFSTGVEVGSAYATFAPIPEPSGALVVLGALGCGVLLRRRTA